MIPAESGRPAATFSQAEYHGGLSWAPDPVAGLLGLGEDHLELVNSNARKVLLTIGVSAIESVEVMSEQVARSKVGAVLLFGVWGGLGAKSAVDRGTLLLHMRSGETAYFTIGRWSKVELLGKLTPWLRQLNIPVGEPGAVATPPQSGLSVADELSKLAALRDLGVLTEEEFAAQKAKLLG